MKNYATPQSNDTDVRLRTKSRTDETLETPGQPLSIERMFFGNKKLLAKVTALQVFAILQTGTAFSELATQDDATQREQLLEEVVVTAHHLKLEKDKSGINTSFFTLPTLFDNVPIDLSEKLRGHPGLSINRTGQPGALTQIRIRGAEANHTLVLIDGIEVNDPATGNEYNFANSTHLAIKSVEVVRGPMTSRYGSEAVGGLIAIETLNPAAQDDRATVYAATGSQNQKELSISAGLASTASVQAGLTVSASGSDGYNVSNFGSEKDGSDKANLIGQMDFQVSEGLSLGLVLLANQTNTMGDEQDFRFPTTPTQGLVIDADEETLFDQTTLGISTTKNGEVFKQRASVSKLSSSTTFNKDSYLQSRIKGEKSQFGYQISRPVNLIPGLNQSVELGLQYENLRFNNFSKGLPSANYEEQDNQLSVYGEYILQGGRSNLSGSIRKDKNSNFLDSVSYNLAFTVELISADTTSSWGSYLHASTGTGVAHPTFFEMFGFIPSSFRGNKNLKPEFSNSWDVGLSIRSDDSHWVADLTYFKANLEKEIFTAYDPETFIASAVNAEDDSDRRGIELSLSASVLDAAYITAGYTYLDSKDSDLRIETRRPRDSGFIRVTSMFHADKGTGVLSYSYTGEQSDSEFVYATPADRVDLDSYGLLDIDLGYQISESFRIFFSASNILDTEYVEVFGYRSPGRALKLGVRAAF